MDREKCVVARPQIVGHVQCRPQPPAAKHERHDANQRSALAEREHAVAGGGAEGLPPCHEPCVRKHCGVQGELRRDRLPLWSQGLNGLGVVDELALDRHSGLACSLALRNRRPTWSARP